MGARGVDNAGRRLSGGPLENWEIFGMRGLRFDRLLTGTALALLLSVAMAIPLATAQVNAPETMAIENGVPMPDRADLAPPTASEVTAPPPAAAIPTATQGIATPAEAPAAEPAPSPRETAAPTQPAPAPVETTAAPVQAPPETTATVESPRAPTEQTAAPAETAAAPAQTPVDPLASLDPADRAIAERLRDVLPRSDRTFANRKERQAVEAFYETRHHAPIWFEAGVANARAKAAIARIQKAAADGLNPADYRIPDLAVAATDAQADVELRLTATLVTFTRHLQAGRFPYSRMGGEIMLPQTPPDIGRMLTILSEATDVAAAIDAYSPPHPGYRALKAKLAELRGETSEEKRIVRIPEGRMLKPGMEDPRVPLLRQRLNVAGDESNTRYDEPLVAAIRAYQKANRINPDGMLGNNTVRSLNAVTTPQRAEVVDTIIANMERWRWLPRDLGDAHVMLNIPNYTLRVMRDGAEVWQTRVVVGKPSTPTPLLTETMKFITINPTWNVPPSIVRNEYLPALAQDPTVLARMGLRVSYNRDGSVHISQPPGDRNALGRVRFNFPNRFLVYQHDTPDKHLFAHERRAYSHGCMRVQDPLRYAEVLLSIVLPKAGYTQQRLRAMYGPSEHNIQFPTHIPVHITYQTAFVDDAGALQIRQDIYGLDAKTKNLIRSERGVVEPAPERPPAVASNNAPARRATTPARPRQPQQPQQQQRTVGFFEALFGGGAQAPQPGNQRGRRTTR
jgi:murein L,D-transpeptidase YcbB/YkuD